MKITRTKIIAAISIVAVLALAFFWGGSLTKTEAGGEARQYYAEGIDASATGTPALQDIPSGGGDEKIPLVPAPSPSDEVEDDDEEGSEEPETAASPEVISTPEPTETPSEATETPPPTATPEPQPSMEINPDTGTDRFLTNPVPEGKPVPVEPQDVTIGETAYTCTITIRCDTILDNMRLLDPEKVELIPEDGVILAEITATFYEGESVFNVLQRETKRHKIHMEFMNTPIYNSAYIEGIHNLYEFDCGELSGWMYKVNDWFPNYGCSRYQLKDGDVIQWLYTCDLGRDVGDNSMMGWRV